MFSSHHNIPSAWKCEYTAKDNISSWSKENRNRKWWWIKPLWLKGLSTWLSLRRLGFVSCLKYMNLLLTYKVFGLFWLGLSNKINCISLGTDGFGLNYYSFRNINHMLDRITSPMCVFFGCFFRGCTVITLIKIWFVRLVLLREGSNGALWCQEELNHVLINEGRME